MPVSDLCNQLARHIGEYAATLAIAQKSPGTSGRTRQRPYLLQLNYCFPNHVRRLIVPTRVCQRNRRPLLVILAAAWISWTGCAAIDPAAGCRCGHCQRDRMGPEALLTDLARTFDRYVVGATFDAEAAPVAKGNRPARNETHTLQADYQQAIDLDTPIGAEPMSMPEPQPILEPASTAGYHQPCALDAGMPMECGPPGRFFPVPARPVFSPPTTPDWLR